MIPGSQKYIITLLWMFLLCFTSCSQLVKFGFHAWDSCSGEWGTAQAQAYFFLSDSVMISSAGMPSLCLEHADSIRVLEEIGRELYDNDQNRIATEYILLSPVKSFSTVNPYKRHECTGIIKLSTSSDTCKNALANLQKIEKGAFEFNGAANFYARHGNPDALGIFTTTSSTYKKYRMINGIVGDSMSLKNIGASYLFTASDIGAGRRVLAVDSVYPLLCRGYLPSGISRLTETSSNDYIFEYKSGASIWIHLRPNASICNINHPEYVDIQQALEILNTEFPVSNRFRHLSDVKTSLSNSEAIYNIYLRTDRCIIFASCTDRKEFDLFTRMLRDRFIEKNADTMNLFYRLANEYDDSVWNYFPDLSWDFTSNARDFKQTLQNENKQP